MNNPFAGARIAKVVKMRPEAHACDLIYLDNLARVPMVQIMGGVSSDSGLVDLHDADVDDQAAQRALYKQGQRDLYAVVLPVGGIPLVAGFLPPQVSQVLFRRKNFRVNRHPSDVYSTLEDDGAFTMAWPNGTYLKVGADPAKEDLSGKDFDGRWKVARNQAVVPKIRLVVADGAGAEKVQLDVDGATGNVTIDVKGNETITIAGNASLSVTGNITSSAAGWTHTGPLDVHGTLHTTQDITCDTTITATTDVVGGGKHLKTHQHTGVQTGGGVSGPPQ